MDFSKFDNRAAAERGKRVVVLNPTTKEPMIDDKGKECAVVVRGSASRDVQAAKKRAMREAMKKDRMNKGDDKEPTTVEDLHKTACEAAAPYIIGFENIERDGRLCVAPDDVQWFLDLSFPIIKANREDNGDVSFDVVNLTFAKQVIEAAEGSDFLD
jgi:hypothetical protein